MNKPLLEKIKKHILEEPKRFFMWDVVLTGKEGEEFTADDGSQQKFASCGTAACIAGWACLLSGQDEVTMLNAEDLLGISSVQGSDLFLDGFWPDKFKTAYRAAKTQDERAKVGAARIDHFIETGE